MKNSIIKLLNKKMFFNKNLGSSQRYTAFTLAEVLITLGIIGVVAALTIPTLMQKTQEKQLRVAAKKAFSVANASLEQFKNDEGETFDEYFYTVNSFKPVYMKYFHVLKDCGLADCVPNDGLSNTYKTLAGERSYTTAYTINGQFITTDGMFWGFWNPGNTEDAIYIFVDVNGYQKKPNTFGKDMFLFEIWGPDRIKNFNKPDIKPYEFTNEKPNSGTCSRTSTYAWNGWDCMYYVMQDIDY